MIAVRLADKVAPLLDRVEALLRPANQLDYSIRRWLIPIGPDASAGRRTASARSGGVLTDVQAEIGRRLRAEYDLTRPTPPYLACLLREFERNGASEGIARHA
jgi:hypothetical protein